MHVTGIVHALILLDFLIASVLLSTSKGRGIMIGAVMPFNSTRLFSVPRVKPAATIAMSNIKKKSILHDLSISYKDSRCDEAYGMNHAINLYIKSQVNVFFGPVCDYAAAPVARQTKFWNMPMVSIGTIALDYRQRRDTVYPLLTRAGPVNLGSLVNSFKYLLTKNKWTKVKVIYQQKAYGEILTRFCHLAAEMMVSDFSDSGFNLDYYHLVENKDEMDDVLLREIANTYGGRKNNILFSCCSSLLLRIQRIYTLVISNSLTLISGQRVVFLIHKVLWLVSDS